jgi:hypothetical protein
VTVEKLASWEGGESRPSIPQMRKLCQAYRRPLAFGELGTGWAGVYRWCQQAVRAGKGRLSGHRLLFAN